jgi:hypothetical protein
LLTGGAGSIEAIRWSWNAICPVTFASLMMKRSGRLAPAILTATLVAFIGYFPLALSFRVQDFGILS